MNKIMSEFKAFATDENAVTAIEYALMAALLATSIVVAVGLVGDALVAVFSSLGTLIGSAFS